MNSYTAPWILLEARLEQVEPVVDQLIGWSRSVIKRPILKRVATMLGMHISPSVLLFENVLAAQRKENGEEGKFDTKEISLPIWHQATVKDYR